MNSNIAIITDQHFGVRNDAPQFLDYFQKFYEEIFFPYIDKHNIKEIITLGDTLDRRRYVNFNTLFCTRQMWFEQLQKRNIKLHSILGNHDTYYKNTSTVNSVRELSSQYSNITIYEETTNIQFGNTKVLFVPWINDENYERSINLIRDTDAKIIMGHLELQGFLMNRGQRCEHGLERKLFSRFDAVYSGHFHHKSSESNIHYLGSPYENTFADINDPRGFHDWNSQTGALTFIQNPFQMFYKVVYDDGGDKPLRHLLKRISDKFTNAHIKVIVKQKTKPHNFDLFMEKLFSLSPADIKIEENIELQSIDETVDIDSTENTLSILNKYVDNLEIDTDKEKIKEELRLLYNDAIMLET